MNSRITIYEDRDPIEVHSIRDLESTIREAAAHARSEDCPNIIFVEAPNGNNLSIVVGADETVLGFTYGHNDPPYYLSRGVADTDDPVFTAYVSMNHHTEFCRRNVIPIAEGLAAVREFAESAELPNCATWDEV